MLTLEDRFVGCLLGVALGDALGAPYEGSLVARAAWKVLTIAHGRRLRYTDDTEMTLLLARSLCEHGGVQADRLAHAWAHGAHWSRGYGAGTSKLLARIRGGEDWRSANRAVFTEGSFGNGAAMRAAPIGLWFHRDPAALVEAAEVAASITHAHALGIEGGVLIARATAMALVGDVDLGALRAGCREDAFRRRLEAAEDVTMDIDTVVNRLGNTMEAHNSVVTALHAAQRFDAFPPLMEFVISLGGDVDTIGAMAGGIFGARHGTSALPAESLARLEDRDAIEATARTLHASWVRAQAGASPAK